MHKQYLSELEGNYDDIAHAAKNLDRNIKMNPTQCEQMADYQYSVIYKSNFNRNVSNNTVTRIFKQPAMK
jgi:hypothetical protein